MVFTFVRLALARTWDQCKTLEECHQLEQIRLHL